MHTYFLKEPQQLQILEWQQPLIAENKVILTDCARFTLDKARYINVEMFIYN